MRRKACIVFMAVLLVGGFATGTPTAARETVTRGGRSEPALPIVFVHGGAGSAAQYRTQQMRFASNGYPNVVRAIDRPAGVDFNPLFDDYIDDILAETGDSRCTCSRTRSARYHEQLSQQLDPNGPHASRSTSRSTARPRTVRRSALSARTSLRPRWARMATPKRSLRRSPSCSSTSSLRATPPATTEIVPEDNPEISGRVINFPANTGPGAGR